MPRSHPRRAAARRSARRGKGVKSITIVDRHCLPLAVTTHAAAPSADCLIARHMLEAHDRVLPTQPGLVVAAEGAKALYWQPSGCRSLYSRHSSIRVTPLVASSRWIDSKSGVG